MPRAPADVRKPKRDSRLRPLKPGKIDPFGWVVDEPVRKVEAQPIEHNIHGLETKPSFYEMVKAALLADKMQYLRGVSIHNILKHVAANWPVDLATYRRLTRAAVKRALENGKIETVGGVGVTYRLAPAERPSANRKKANQEEEEEEVKPRKPKTQRKTTAIDGDAKPKKASKKRVADDSDEEEEPKKIAKKPKAVKKSAGYNAGDHAEQQSGEGKWIWQYQDGGWHDYDPKAGDEVESTYQLYEKEKATGRVIDVRAVKSGTWEYQIDFRQFTQQNIRHEAHTIRAIRRVWRSL